MDSTAAEIRHLQREVEKLKKDVARLKLKNGRQGTKARKEKASSTGRSRQKAKRSEDERLRRQFGAVNLGKPLGASNEEIDRDLAREYARDHKDQ